jgi:hypothetical protein
MNLRKFDSRLQPLLRAALDAGCSMHRGGNNHYILKLPSGRNLVYACTSRSNSGILNSLTLTRRTLRAEGILTEQK